MAKLKVNDRIYLKPNPQPRQDGAFNDSYDLGGCGIITRIDIEYNNPHQLLSIQVRLDNDDFQDDAGFWVDWRRVLPDTQLVRLIYG